MGKGFKNGGARRGFEKGQTTVTRRTSNCDDPGVQREHEGADRGSVGKQRGEKRQIHATGWAENTPETGDRGTTPRRRPARSNQGNEEREAVLSKTQKGPGGRSEVPIVKWQIALGSLGVIQTMERVSSRWKLKGPDTSGRGDKKEHAGKIHTSNAN